jgi:Skp family chaperone for outer membrane proteins
MTTYVLDFEEVLRNFQPYHESLKMIQKEKKEFAELIEGIKKEMETIIASNKSLILDDTTNQKNQLRFRELQNKAVQAESEFRTTIVDKQNEEVEKNFAQIMDLVNDYASEKSLDLVVNKNQVVFVNPKFEITNEIIEIVKTKELYLEYVEGMYEAEVTA